MNVEIIVGIVGFFTTITSGWTSWFFARKKYNSEVDHNHIDNMKEALDFYRTLSDDNKIRLDELSERNNQLESEIIELRKQVLDLTMNICFNLTYDLRQKKNTPENTKNNGT